MGITALYIDSSILSQKLDKPLGKQVPQSSHPAAWVWVKEHGRSHSLNGQDSVPAPEQSGAAAVAITEWDSV